MSSSEKQQMSAADMVREKRTSSKEEQSATVTGQTLEQAAGTAATAATAAADKIRTTLDLTAEMKGILETLSKRYASQADTLRHAIYLLNAVKEAEAHGL